MVIRQRTECLQAGLPPRGMPEELTTSPGDIATSDLNSNHTTEPVGTAGATGASNGSFAASNASSQDLDFIQDNSDYQWFLDYGYREAPGGQHVSVLSYSEDAGVRHGGSRYDDLARDLDANLAEVDMEDLRTEDIHSILSTLPAMCCADIQAERRGEMYASVSGSMMAKFEFDSSVSPRSSSQVKTSAKHRPGPLHAWVGERWRRGPRRTLLPVPAPTNFITSSSLLCY